MQEHSSKNATILGTLLAVGLIGLGLILGNAARSVKMLERTVTVKGLAEREVAANVAIWPISFQLADNDLTALYASIESTNETIRGFLQSKAIEADEISSSPPAVSDMFANSYGGREEIRYRYTANCSITVYSEKVESVRKAMADVVELGKQGVALTGNMYGNQTQFLFTGLNDLKPAMVEEATANGRVVAEKFAADSRSRLGKIRSASQGQFSIEDRDATTAHIKRVRVVSTLEYYLAD